MGLIRAAGIFCIAGKSVALDRTQSICEALRRSSLFFQRGLEKKNWDAVCESSGTIKCRAGYDINDLHRSVLRAVSRAKVSVLVLPVRTRLLHVKTRGANRGVCVHACTPRRVRACARVTLRGNDDVPLYPYVFFSFVAFKIAICTAR